MKSGIAFSIVLTVVFVASSPLQAQTSPPKRPGFSSTTKPTYTTTNEFVPDGGADPNRPIDPNTVIDVRIVGNDQIGAKDIIQIIKTRKGRPFNEAVVEEDKRALMQKGWFFDIKPKVEKTPAGFIVTFQFIERPILHYVKVVGNKAHTKKVLLEEAGIAPGAALDPIAVHQAKERMEQFYKDSGFYRVHIDILSGDQDGDRGATFKISEGDKQRILDVDFEGNTLTTSNRLKTLIQSKPGWFFWVNSEFTRKQLDEDVEALTAYYRKLGYFYAKIDRKFVETSGKTGWGKDRCWVKIVFVIEEGPRCLNREFRFNGNSLFSSDELLKVMKLPKEKFYNHDMLEADMARLKEKYGKLGFVFSQTEPDPRIDDDHVDMMINVKEGPRCSVGSISIDIAGNEGAESYTKLQPVLNRLSFRPGDLLRTTDINSSKRRLAASQIFNANPTQGQIPEIIFEYPQLAAEEEEREEQLASGMSKIRGQAPTAQERIDIATARRLAAYTKDRPVSQPQTLSQQQSPPSDHYVAPREPYPAYPGPQVPACIPQSGSQVPAHPVYPPRSSYDPTQGRVEPMKLALKTPVETDDYDTETSREIYRGQTSYTPPMFGAAQQQSASPNPSSPFSAIYNPPSVQAPATLQYTQTSGFAASNTTTTFGSLSATSTPTADLAPAPLLASNQTAVANNPYQYLPPQYSSPNGSAPEVIPVQTKEVPGYAQIGGTALYNNGTIPSPTTGATTQEVFRGLPGMPAIKDSAYGFDPSAPSAMQGKLYPTDVVVHVQETRTGQLMMSVAVSSDSGLMGRFVIEEQNFDALNFPKGWRLTDWKNAFRGKGQRFRIEAVPGTQVQRYEVSWQTPYLFDQEYSLGLSGFYYQRYYDEWYEDRVGGSVSVGKLWTPDFSTSMIFNGQQVHIYHPISQAPDLYEVLGHHPMYGLGLNATYNTRDSEYIPTEGMLISGGIEQVFGDYKFLRGNIDVRKYFTLHERADRSGRWVLGLRSSLALTEGGTPIYERYYAGGFTNLRGFEFRGVTPRYPGDHSGIGGCMEFYNSAELIFPITADDMIRGSVFLDTGTVETSITDWKSRYRVAIGFGLRLTIPMMGPAPIALDFAFPLSKDPGDIKQVFSFNVGFMR